MVLTVTPDDSAALHHLVELVAAERKWRNSPLWTSNMEQAHICHGVACDAVWNELYRLLDGSTGIEPSSDADFETPDTIRELVVKHLKRELPQLVADAMESF